MAKIKSYTDISQSKKLAEILPLGSADNVIVSFGDRYGVKTVVMPKETLDVIRTPFADIRETTICWSLAALIEVLPLIEGFKPVIDLDINQILYEGKYRDELNVNSENLIDVCYEMIIRLHELKML